ncbi:MAG: DUF4837 family protein [Bacteroidales bacterium]|nr:DUF4837 family protein [Bacteroidales bacterium]
MKRTIHLMMAVVAVLLLASCGGDKLSGLPGSSGKTLELLLVANNNAYSNRTQMVIDTLFRVPQPGLEGFNQPEPRFDVIRITNHDFEGNKMFQAHRNILLLEVAESNPNKLYMKQDSWASPQIVIQVKANSQKALDSLLYYNRDRLYKEYYNQEYRRMHKVFSAAPNYKVNEAVKQKYGLNIIFPEEFYLAKSVDNFMWIRKETKDFSLIVLFNQAPYDTPHQFEEPMILDNLDTMLKHNVPSPNEKGYMATERRDFFHTRDVHLGDIFAIETRGRYCCVDDFYGGPFVCYTFQTPNNEDVVTMFAFVHSPSHRSKSLSKRDLLMQVDGICHTAKW